MNLPPSAENALQTASRSWEEVASLPGSRLLKLAILRDLERSLHALTSRSLALSEPREARDLERMEKRLSALTSHSLSESRLEECLSGIPQSSSNPSPQASSLPEKWVHAIGKHKLLRNDRIWEQALVKEGALADWELWEAQATIPIAEVTTWNTQLASGLWPEGILLFMESLELESGHGAPAGFWPGRWWMIRHPASLIRSHLSPNPLLVRRS